MDMKRLLLSLVFLLALVACGTRDATDIGDTTVTTIATTTTTTTAVFTGGIFGSVTAGPVCPVMQDPPDPMCANRPVADARIIVFADSGTAVAHTITSEGGMFTLHLAPGIYEVVAEPVPGLMGLPAPLTIEVGDRIIDIELEYDTGIR